MGGTYLHFGWLAVWVLSLDWQCRILNCATIIRRLSEATTPESGGVAHTNVFASSYTMAFALHLRKIAENLSRNPKIAQLISAEHDSFSRLGHRLATASTASWPPSLMLSRRTTGSTLGQRKYLPSCPTRGIPTSANKIKVRSRGSDVVDELWNTQILVILLVT
jgi:hypothetical protein